MSSLVRRGAEGVLCASTAEWLIAMANAENDNTTAVKKKGASSVFSIEMLPFSSSSDGALANTATMEYTQSAA